jgi:NADPH-dependent curcumin reductase CurA
MRGGTVARVLASKNPKVKEGDLVSATIGWTEVAITNEKGFEKVEIPKNGRITDILGVLGMYSLSIIPVSPLCVFVIIIATILL